MAVVDQRGDESGELGLAPDPADAHRRRAWEAEAGIGEQALADLYPVSPEIIEQSDIVAPVGHPAEDGLEVRADRGDDPLDRPPLAPVGGEFEDEMGIAPVRAGNGVE